MKAVPLSENERYILSWEAATERLIGAAGLAAASPAPREDVFAHLAYAAHYAMGVPPLDDYFRGALPVSAPLLDAASSLLGPSAIAVETQV